MGAHGGFSGGLGPCFCIAEGGTAGMVFTQTDSCTGVFTLYAHGGGGGGLPGADGYSGKAKHGNQQQ
jgi:hypothetical protein